MSGQFRWGDLLDHDSTEREAAYLGTTTDDDDQRVHYWDDGTTLPVLAGSASDGTDDDPDDFETEDDTEEGADLDADETDDEDDEDAADAHKGKRRSPKPASVRRAHRQAARFRIDAKEQRERADSAEARERTLRLEIAFTRAAGLRFVDGDAAWKLVDRSLLVLGEDGTVTGTDAAIAKLTDAYPFLTQTDDEGDDSDDDRPGKDRNPFHTTSGTPMAGKRAAHQRIAGDHTSAAVLAKKYPVLHGRR